MTREERDKLFEELYRGYYRNILTFFVRLGFSGEQALDLAQSTYLRVYNSMDTYRREARWAFLETTARRVALNEIRRTKGTLKRQPEESLDALPLGPPALAESIWPDEPQPRQDERLIVDEQQKLRRRRIALALAALPDLSRECLRLSLQGHSGREIGERLGITHEAVRSRLHDARKRLKKMLNENPDGIDWPNGSPENDQ